VAARKKPEKKAAEPLEKMANLLALLVVKEKTLTDAIMQLDRAGFSDDEIGSLLDTTGGMIRQTRYMANKRAKK
jgi:hypothetical protein